MKSSYSHCVIVHFRSSESRQYRHSSDRLNMSSGCRGLTEETGKKNWLGSSPSMWESVGWDRKRQERKKSSVCCCSPVLQAEIRLINSRDNVEMNSMTSILGTEAQQHHCAALQPALCWVNSGSHGRKELIDGSPLCIVGHPIQSQLINGEGTLPASQRVLVDQQLKQQCLSSLLHWQTVVHLVAPNVFIGLYDKSLRFCWDDSYGWLSVFLVDS